ncbi:hypothetical protein KC19_2G061500 [Ceratodon purpureus]|uniref:Secreted protein n=1 Tax=Ceratodon purpureus TaxID=3225 RepID=A0A8T0ITI8_CERPU|nr:hypothetical protein KC19_2G061500 [Ceratodon purpureus]
MIFRVSCVLFCTFLFSLVLFVSESESVISASLPMVNNYLVPGRLRGHKMDECMLKSHGLNRGSSSKRSLRTTIRG